MAETHILHLNERIAESLNVERLGANPILYRDITGCIATLADGDNPAGHCFLGDAAEALDDLEHVLRSCLAEGHVLLQLARAAETKIALGGQRKEELAGYDSLVAGFATAGSLLLLQSDGSGSEALQERQAHLAHQTRSGDKALIILSHLVGPLALSKGGDTVHHGTVGLLGEGRTRSTQKLLVAAKADGLAGSALARPGAHVARKEGVHAHIPLGKRIGHDNLSARSAQLRIDELVGLVNHCAEILYICARNLCRVVAILAQFKIQ